MLRVTEEKERNFEKRGYMGKKVLGVLTILLILTGCQNMGNEAENLQQVEKQENGDWLLFGYCCIWEWEWGYVMLSELEELEFPIKEFKDAAGRKVKEYM